VHYTKLKSLENISIEKVNSQLTEGWVCLGVEQWREADEEHFETKTRYILGLKEDFED